MNISQKNEVTDRFGRVVISLSTVDFVNWLNEHILPPSERAEILVQHTVFLPDKPMIEF